MTDLETTQRSTPTSAPYGGGAIGFVFGLLLGVAVGVSWWFSFDAVALLFLPPLPMAFLGARYGDRFWHWCLRWLDWFF